jgi:glucan biosynthesis protein C
VVWQITWSLISWSSVIFMLNLGAKYLSFTNKLLAYSNEAVLPFYLFHQTIILIVGWFVLPWDINSVAKFLIIAVVSFPLILILYEVFVRHIGFMRFLFGMTPKKKHSTAPGD